MALGTAVLGSTLAHVTGSEPDYAAEWGRGLRAQREATAVSLRELSSRIGYSTSYLSRVETGHRAATGEILRLYAALPSSAPLGRNPDADRAEAARLPASQSVCGGLDLGIVWYGAELRRREKMIMHAVHLAFARGARGGGDHALKLRALAHEAVAERAFAGADGAGDDQQDGRRGRARSASCRW